MKELIAAIEGRRICRERNEYEAGKNAALKIAVDLINTHMAGKVIVPVELIQNIDDLTEAGFGAEEQIDELCLLLSTIGEQE